jgi:thioredoxin-like negative regulator of GroEL
MDMKELNTFEQLKEKVDIEEKVLIFITNDFCSVCHADLPRIDKLCEKHNFPAYHVNITNKPMVAGQFTLFSVPAVILFFKGKEYHRQVHIIDFKELEYRIEELKNAPLED